MLYTLNHWFLTFLVCALGTETVFLVTGPSFHWSKKIEFPLQIVLFDRNQMRQNYRELYSDHSNPKLRESELFFIIESQNAYVMPPHTCFHVLLLYLPMTI